MAQDQVDHASSFFPPAKVKKVPKKLAKTAKDEKSAKASKDNAKSKDGSKAPQGALKKVPSIEALNSEMPCRDDPKDKRKRLFKCLINRLMLKKSDSATISRPDPTYRVAYLGNVVTGWAKGDGCVEKPLATLWRNYAQSAARGAVRMRVTVCAGGLRAATRQHGLTEYWAHRLTACAAPPHYPRLFAWVYRHEGRRLRHELRCHAVLCPSASVARRLEEELRKSVTLALAEFRRERLQRQNARLSLAGCANGSHPPAAPRRRLMLSVGAQNYRPPLERSKSAPKLTAIEEILEEEDIFESSHQIYKEILKYYDWNNTLLDKRKNYILSKIQNNIVPAKESEKEEKENTVKFSDEVSSVEEGITSDSYLDDKQDLILDELVHQSLADDLLESCERAWYALGVGNADSDKGSLSSGCESATSATLSDIEPTNGLGEPLSIGVGSDVEEVQTPLSASPKLLDVPRLTSKTDFRVGDSVLSRVRSCERLSTDLFSLYSPKTVPPHEEVSLVPVGESHSDFSSLKVFKKRSMSESGKESLLHLDQVDNGNSSQEEDDERSYSDESGYEEEMASSVGNIVLV